MISEMEAILNAHLTQAEDDRDKALAWVFRLVEAIDELDLWEPGRKGYAAALRRLRAERDWAWREMAPLSSTERASRTREAPADAAASAPRRPSDPAGGETARFTTEEPR